MECCGVDLAERRAQEVSSNLIMHTFPAASEAVIAVYADRGAACRAQPTVVFFFNEG